MAIAVYLLDAMFSIYLGLKGSFRYADVAEIRDLQHLASVFVCLPFLF